MRLVASLMLLAVAAASPDVRYFRYQRSLQTVPDQSGQSCLALDAGILSHSSPQLADLRLYRDGAETPYVVRMATPIEGTEKSIAPLNLGIQNRQTTFDAELPNTHYSDLQLDVTAQNFIATVRVSGSRTQVGRTNTKLGEYTIFDLTRQKLGRSTILHLPESDFPYLHFRINGPITPDKVAGISVERLPATQPRYETVAESRLVTQKGHTSILEFTVPAHVRLDRIAFMPGATPALFSRNVSIRVDAVTERAKTDPEAIPQPVLTSGNILRVHSRQDGHLIDEERLAIDAPEAYFDTAAKWTIAIDNGDDAPLAIHLVQLQMLEERLCFDAVANASYTLYYGDPTRTTPRYDYATLFAPEANAAPVTAEPEQPNPNYQPRPDERPFTEKHPALLWIALLAVIAALGGIALRSQKPTLPTP